MKSRLLTLTVVLIGVLVAGFFVKGLLEEQPIVWESTYSRHDKQPYGSYLLYERLPDVFPKQKLSLSTEAATEKLRNAYSGEQGVDHVSPAPDNIGAYLMIGNSYPMSDEDWQAVASYVRQGGTVFLASSFADDDPLMNFLNVKRTFTLYKDLDGKDVDKIGFIHRPTKTTVQLETKAPNSLLGYSFDQLPSVADTVVTNQYGDPVFVKIPYGAGTFYTCAIPQLFTNYFLLKPGGSQLVGLMMSHVPHIPQSRVLWDEYYKHEGHEQKEMQQNLFRFIYKYPTLQWAFYLMLFLVGVYLLSELRRKQREIPIEEPLPNATLEFAGTIGSLYFRNGDHKNIAEKKIRYFHEFIRTRFYIRVNEGDEQTLQALAGRSGIPAEELAPLFHLIGRIRTNKTTTEEELIELSSRLDTFYKTTA